MLEVAGGVVLGGVLLLLLPSMLVGAYWLIVWAAGIAVLGCIWLALAAAFGHGAAAVIMLIATACWIGWADRNRTFGNDANDETCPPHERDRTHH